MKNFLLLFFLITVFVCKSQNPGDVAQNFGTYVGFDGAVKDIQVQNDGKILVGGLFESYRGHKEGHLIRLNPDGTKDTTFELGVGFNGTVITLAIQLDGKILVGGDFQTYNGLTQNNIIRLNSDGSKDTTFNIGNGCDRSVESIVLQPDGKILIGGDFSHINNELMGRIVRLNSDGSKDTSFNIGNGFNSAVVALALQTDGKILIGGWFTTYNGVNSPCLIRLNTDGSKDSTFDVGSGFESAVNSLAMQTDGKIVVGGNFNTYKGLTQKKLIRLNVDGSKDNSFNTGLGFYTSFGAYGGIEKVGVQPDGKILAGGRFDFYNGTQEKAIIRLNTDGTKDTSFNQITSFDGVVMSFSQLSDGKTIVGGGFVSYKGKVMNNIARLNSDASEDITFDLGTGFSSVVNSVVTQSDGKILVGGDFSRFNGQIEKKFIRLNADGTKDTSFLTGTGFDNIVNTIVVQPDGKILVGGSFNQYNNVSVGKIIRLNSDGTIDTTFSAGAGVDSSVFSIVVQPDGKILVGGNFSYYNLTTTYAMIRLNADGSRDMTFDTQSLFAFLDSVHTIVLQNDGKIIVGGDFTNNIVRLNPDGSKDLTFNIGTGFDSYVLAIALQYDGKIIIGGYFKIFNNDAYHNVRIIRLNSDGTKDMTFDSESGFNPGSGFGPFVRTIALQPDNKILIGGYFSIFNGNEANNFTRLNPDGTQDTTFNIGQGFKGVLSNKSIINSISLQVDGKILLGGFFANYKGSNESAMLIGLHSGLNLSTENFHNSNSFTISPNPVKDFLHIQSNDFTAITTVKIYDLQGKLIQETSTTTIPVSSFAKGLYIVKVTTENGELNKKFVKE